MSIYTYHRDDTWDLTSDGYVNNFDDYRSNRDSDVDTADGKFTASVEGVYQFNFQVLRVIPILEFNSKYIKSLTQKYKI